MGMTEAQRSRQIRQDSLRELLEKQGHLQHILEMSDKLSNLDDELDALKIQRLRAVIDTKLKLLNKYLPDLKAVEIEGNIDSSITIVRKSYSSAD